MKRLSLLTLVILLGFAHQARSLTPEEIRKGYAGCEKFLALSSVKQAKVARKTGHSLKTVRKVCREMKRKGLQTALRLEAEYQRGLRAPVCPVGYHIATATACCPNGTTYYKGSCFVYSSPADGDGSSAGDESSSSAPPAGTANKEPEGLRWSNTHYCPGGQCRKPTIFDHCVAGVCDEVESVR